MKLIIENCQDPYFILYLIKFLKNYILHSINNKKLILLDEYINSLPLYKSKFIKSIACRNIIIAGAYNIEYKKFGTTYVISINSSQKFYGVNAKLIDLCRLINYGTVSISGYPIFTEAFNYVNENLQLLYFKYTRGF